jgi:hypothetical protein
MWQVRIASSAMKEILAAVGLAEHSAEEIEIHGERAIRG